MPMTPRKIHSKVGLITNSSSTIYFSSSYISPAFIVIMAFNIEVFNNEHYCPVVGSIGENLRDRPLDSDLGSQITIVVGSLTESYVRVMAVDIGKSINDIYISKSNSPPTTDKPLSSEEEMDNLMESICNLPKIKTDRPSVMYVSRKNSRTYSSSVGFYLSNISDAMSDNENFPRIKRLWRFD